MIVCSVAAALLSLAGTRDWASAQCEGDCNVDGSVSIAELITAVNIALGLEPPGACPPYGGPVEVGDLVKAVGDSLSGCGAISPTPTATPGTPGSPTAHPTTTASKTLTRSGTATRTPTSSATPAPPTVTSTSTATASPTTLPVGFTLLRGRCEIPGGDTVSGGRKACPENRLVRAYRCNSNDQSRCRQTEQAREPLGDRARTDPSGRFAIAVPCDAVPGKQRLLLIAEVGEANREYDSPRCVERSGDECLLYDLGAAAACSARLRRGVGDQSGIDLLVDSDSTGVVRAVDADGLENFSPQNLSAVLDGTREAELDYRFDSIESAALRAQRVAETLIEPQIRIQTSQDGRSAYYIIQNTSIFHYAITTVAIDGGSGDGGVNSCEVRGISPGGGAVGDDVSGPEGVFIAPVIPSAQEVGFSDAGQGRVCPNCSDSDCQARTCDMQYAIDDGMVALASDASPLRGVERVFAAFSFGTCTLRGETLAFGEPPPTVPTTRLQRGGEGPTDGFRLAKSGEAKPGDTVIFASATTINSPGFGVGGFRLDDGGRVIKGLGVDVEAPSRRLRLEFEARDLPVDVFPRALWAGPLNGDPLADIVLVDEGAGRVTVQISRGDGQFTAAPGSPYDVGDFPVAVAVANVTGDSLPDIVTADEGAGTVTVLRQNPNGSFTLQQTVAVAPFPLAVALGDVDGTRGIDIVTVHEPNGITLRLNGGSGAGFQPPPAPLPALPAGSYPSAVAVAQLDGANGDDIVTANSGLGNVSVLLAGAPATAEYRAVDFPGALVAADLDGTKGPDIAATSQADHVVAVLLNDGHGAFAPAPDSPYRVDPRRQCVGLQKCPAGLFPALLVVGDIDADGHGDLIIANEGSSDVSVLLNHGDGTFDPARVFPVPEFPSGSVTTRPFPITVGVANIDANPGADLIAASDVAHTALLLLQR